MAVLEWIILTEAQHAEALALNDDSTAVEGRRVDNLLSPLFGQLVLPARILTAEGFERWGPSLSPLPRQTLDSLDLFVPSGD